MLKPNKGLERIRNGGIVTGIMLAEITNSEIIPAIKAAGFDAVFLDLEHGAFSLESVKAIARISLDHDIWCFARVHTDDLHLITRIQDAGVTGIMLAHCEDPIHIQSLIAALKFPPMGTKGFGIRGVHTNYQPHAIEELMTHHNHHSAIIVQIESKKALENLDAIAQLDHIDVLFPGPTDLSISLGVAGQLDHPKVEAALQSVVEVGKKYNIPVAHYSSNMANLLHWKAQGCRLLFFGTEMSLLIQAGCDAVTKLRKEQ